MPVWLNGVLPGEVGPDLATQLWVLGGLVAALATVLWFFIRSWMGREEKSRETLAERVRLLEVEQAKMGTPEDLASKVLPQLLLKLDAIRDELRKEWKEDLEGLRREIVRLLDVSDRAGDRRKP